MKLARFFHIFLGFLIFSASIAAQTAETTTSAAEIEKAPQETEKKALVLLEQAIGDADALKLAENRVYVFGSAGEMLWTHDEKRARQLFRRAAGEMISAYNASETDESEDELPENFWMLQNARNQFLNTVANRDAELALELLRQTRFPIFERALNLPPEKIPLYRNLYQQAQSELNLEKEFTVRLIKQNPRRALEIARANLSRGVTYSDLNLINALKETDPKIAAQFADEVLQKLLTSNFSDQYDHNTRSLAWSFLSQFSQPQQQRASETGSTKSEQFTIDKNDLRALAVKFADYLTGTATQPHNYHEIQNAIPIFERILPERVAPMRQRYERLRQNNNAANPYNQYQEKMNQLNGANAAPETLLAEAENFPVEMRSQLYSTAANRTAQSGNYAGARQIINAMPGKHNREYALFQLDWQAMQKALNEDKYSEADSIILQQNDNSRKIRLLVQAAQMLARKKQPEKAAVYASQARALVKTAPETGAELSDLMQVLSIGAEAEPLKTIDLLDSFAPKFNEIFSAIAFLSKYQPNNGEFREGELVFSNNHGGMHVMSGRRFGGISVSLHSMNLNRLAKANLERTVNLADRFDRSDVRLAARLIILRGVLSESEDAKSSQQPRFRKMDVISIQR